MLRSAATERLARRTPPGGRSELIILVGIRRVRLEEALAAVVPIAVARRAGSHILKVVRQLHRLKHQLLLSIVVVV